MGKTVIATRTVLALCNTCSGWDSVLLDWLPRDLDGAEIVDHTGHDLTWVGFERRESKTDPDVH